MTISQALDLLRLAQPFVYGAVAIVALVHWRRHLGPASAWLSAAFGLFALVLIVSALPEDSFQSAEVAVGKLTISLIALFPYCLYRFLQSFVRPVRWLEIWARVATGVVVLAALALPAFPEDGEREAWFQAFVLGLLIQWMSLLGVVAIGLWRAGRGQPSVARRRMRTMSLGASGLAVALVVAGEVSQTNTSRLIVQLLALFAAPLMLMGFAPPYPLRMWWRRADDAKVLEAEASLIQAESAEQVAAVLLPAARLLLGAKGATLETRDGQVMAGEGISRSPQLDEASDRDLPDAAASEDSVIDVPMRSHRLSVLVSSFTSFFAEEELERLKVLTALADLTLRRQELLDDQRRLAAIVESSSDAILSKSLEGTILGWNRGAEELYGYTSEEIVGKSIKTLVPSGQEGEIDAILERIKRGDAIRNFESRRVRKDGNVIDVSLTISSVRDGDGNITGASTIARDITAAVARRDALAEQAEMLDLAQDAIIACQLDGLITYWNIAAEELFGWSKAEARGRISHELLQTRYPEPIEQINDVLDREGRWEGELIHTTRAGEEVITASKWALRRDDRGAAFQVLEVNNDITGQKAAQAALVEREAMLAAIFETSPDIIATVTSDMEVVYVNAAARQLLGYELEEVFKNGSALVHPDDLPAGMVLLAGTFETKDTIGRRVRVKTAQGDWIWLAIRMRRMTDDANAAVVMVRDVTEQARLEQESHQAKEEAERANLAKSEFLSRMSHELRTPLNAILGFGQLLEQEELTEDQRESTELILKGGQRLLQLINEVLDVSRIEAGTLQMSLEPVSIGTVVHDAVDLIRPLANERSIQMRVDIPAEMSQQHVMADQQRLGQVLLNLLSNAVKYNVEHGTVSVTAMGAGPRTVRIGVTDTGPGIAEDKISLLFTPFERLGAEAGSVEGTGLGLTLSKHLVDAMGGEITVDTMQGQGTTFWIELHLSDRRSTERGDDESLKRAASRTRGKVLYVEDNLSNLTLVERLMSRHGDVQLVSAMTGTLGLDMAQQHLPELILLDLHLPDLRGEEVLIRLRKDPRTKGIPVIVLSADATAGQIERLRQMGADEYMTKPIDVEIFMEMVERRLPGPPEHPEPPGPEPESSTP